MKNCQNPRGLQTSVRNSPFKSAKLSFLNKRRKPQSALLRRVYKCNQMDPLRVNLVTLVHSLGLNQHGGLILCLYEMENSRNPWGIPGEDICGKTFLFPPPTRYSSRCNCYTAARHITTLIMVKSRKNKDQTMCTKWKEMPSPGGKSHTHKEYSF